MKDKRYSILLKAEDGSIVFEKRSNKKIPLTIIDSLHAGKYFLTIRTAMSTMMYPIVKRQ